MGCTGPKSVIPVRNDLTFLDLTVQQIEHLNKQYDCDVPLVLMNSFNTDADTEKVLRKYRGFRCKIFTFMQSRFPRLNKESLMPIANTVHLTDNEAWYPPGHGDFYTAFHKSGLLHNFIDDGKHD
jgi:UTP--glucose-1-phosphate uridylyltransferase